MPVLKAAGWSKSAVRRALKTGDLSRLRRGWYALPDADPQVVRAVKAGGVMTCVSALRFHGVWVRDTQETHLSYSEFGDRRRRIRPGCRRCCPPGQRSAPVLAVDSPEQALAAAAGCLDAEDLVVVMDSLLNLGLMDPDDLAAALRGRGQRITTLVERCARAESGTETLVRERLRRRTRAPIRTQVQIEDIGRVDALVDGRLVIEVDSVSHHTSLAHYRADRWRDLRLIASGYLVIRLTYEQVMYHWAEVEIVLLQLVRSLKPPRRRRLQIRAA